MNLKHKFRNIWLKIVTFWYTIKENTKAILAEFWYKIKPLLIRNFTAAIFAGFFYYLSTLVKGNQYLTMLAETATAVSFTAILINLALFLITKEKLANDPKNPNIGLIYIGTSLLVGMLFIGVYLAKF